MYTKKIRLVYIFLSLSIDITTSVNINYEYFYFYILNMIRSLLKIRKYEKHTPKLKITSAK